MQITDSGLIKAYRNAVLKDTCKLTTKQVRDIINTYYTTKYLDKKDPGTVVYQVNNVAKNLNVWYDEVVNSTEGTPTFFIHARRGPTLADQILAFFPTALFIPTVLESPMITSWRVDCSAVT